MNEITLCLRMTSWLAELKDGMIVWFCRNGVRSVLGVTKAKSSETFRRHKKVSSTFEYDSQEKKLIHNCHVFFFQNMLVCMDVNTQEWGRSTWKSANWWRGSSISYALSLCWTSIIVSIASSRSIYWTILLPDHLNNIMRGVYEIYLLHNIYSWLLL